MRTLLCVLFLATAAQAHDVSISCTPVDTATGYNFLRSDISGGPYAKLNIGVPVPECRFVDYGVIGGRTYYYVVQSVDASGVVSSASVELKAAVFPDPPAFMPGDSFKVNTGGGNLNVRSIPSMTGSVVKKTLPNGSTGTIVGGPTADGLVTFWQIAPNNFWVSGAYIRQ